MLVAIRHPDDPELIRIFAKGAPEYLVNQCIKTIDSDGAVVPLNDSEKTHIIINVLQDNFAKEGFRNLAFAYKDINAVEFESLKSENEHFSTESDRECLEKDMTFVGVFALLDDLRSNIAASIRFATRGNINVRMVSGDSL